MFGIGGCEQVQSSIFWAQRRGKREHQMKGYVVEQKVSDFQPTWSRYLNVTDRRLAVAILRSA